MSGKLITTVAAMAVHAALAVAWLCMGLESGWATTGFVVVGAVYLLITIAWAFDMRGTRNAVECIKRDYDNYINSQVEITFYDYHPTTARRRTVGTHRISVISIQNYPWFAGVGPDRAQAFEVRISPRTDVSRET